MSDARRRAEEALATFDRCRVCQTWPPCRCHVTPVADALRALLAEPAPAPDAALRAALARETERAERAERERDEARDSLGRAAALAMIPLARGEHFKDVPDTQPHAAIVRIREDLNECRVERDGWHAEADGWQKTATLTDEHYRYLTVRPDPAAPSPARDEVREAAEALHPYDDWHEDDGTVLWYAVPVEEPPYCGDPLCLDWPDEWAAPYDTVTGAFIEGPYAGKVLKWQRLPGLPADAVLSALAAKGGA